MGEETRTGVDFMDRYKKTHAQFARLQGMAQEYELMTGVNALTAKGVLQNEAGAASAKEAQQKFDTAKEALPPEKAADITAAQGNLTATQGEMDQVKGAVTKASEDARMGYRDLVSANAEISQKAEQEKAKEKEGEVTAVKAKIKELQGYITGGLDIAVDVAKAGATGGTSAAVSAAQSAAEEKSKAKAKDILKQVTEGLGEAIASDYYKLELQRAEGAVKVANSLAQGYAAEIGGNKVKNAADEWAQNMRILNEKSQRFDALQIQLRSQIKDLGRAIGAAGIGKQEGARYNVIAEFEAEASLFVNECDLAIALGSQNLLALDEGNKKRSAAAYTEKGDQQRRFWSARRIENGQWLLSFEYLHLAGRATQGEGGMVETVKALVEELKAFRDNVSRYRQVLAGAMGMQ